MNQQPEQKTAEREKKIAIDFFYWWHNQPGSNTEYGFDEYKKTERYKMLDVSITIEADERDASLQKQVEELRKEVEAYEKAGELLKIRDLKRECRERKLHQESGCLHSRIESLESQIKDITDVIRKSKVTDCTASILDSINKIINR